MRPTLARMTDPPSGPFVAMAVACHRIDRQPDGAMDVSGIVDGLAFASSADDLAEPVRVPLTLLVVLRAGSIRGLSEVKIQGRYPSGEEGPAVAQRVRFSDESPGATLTVPVELEVISPGEYAFDVSCDGRLLTRVSLIVRLTPPV